MRPLRVYVDTSVFGGMFDTEYVESTRRFFRMFDEGRFRIAVSEQVEEEIDPAPPEVKTFFRHRLPSLEYLGALPEIQKLAGLYLLRGVVGSGHQSDAIHIAYATAHKCDGVVSWNFKHMVKLSKCACFNMINAANDHPQVFIASPKEIEDHERA